MTDLTQKEFLINAGPLVASIKQLKPFIADDGERPYLGGIFFELEEESQTLNLVATDGTKLCILNVDVDRMELFDNGELAAIVPAKALDTILAMLKGVQGDMPVGLRFDEKHLYVDAQVEKGEFRLVDGAFPQYRKVIPTKIPKFIIGLGKTQASAALAAIASQGAKEGLQWQMTNAESPLVIKGENKLVVVMPMRVTLPGEVSAAPAETDEHKQADIED